MCTFIYVSLKYYENEREKNVGKTAVRKNILTSTTYDLKEKENFLLYKYAERLNDIAVNGWAGKYASCMQTFILLWFCELEGDSCVCTYICI